MVDDVMAAIMLAAAFCVWIVGGYILVYVELYKKGK